MKKILVCPYNTTVQVYEICTGLIHDFVSFNFMLATVL
jgi:hypothetical protein